MILSNLKKQNNNMDMLLKQKRKQLAAGFKLS
jgi:hypothetical protein